jgi:hypothetical protein
LVIALLVYGCPVQAIVQAFGIDERTVRNWWQRAGGHCQTFHERMLDKNQLELGQVQADEIKAKTQKGPLWMAMAMMVSTRLWLGGQSVQIEIRTSCSRWLNRCAGSRYVVRY